MESSPKKRLTPNELLTFGQQLLSRKFNGRPLLMAVKLNRSDHLQALVRDPQANLVLTAVMDRVEQRLRPEDRYAVASHDELWILLADVANAAVARAVATGFREALYSAIVIETPDGKTASAQLQPVIGGAWSRSEAIDIAGLLQGAWDNRLYAAEHEDRLDVRQIGADDSAARRVEIEHALRRNLYANELEVHFQPQIDLATNQCLAAEALIRWPREHPLQVSPALIASICDNRGMIGQLTQFVINTVLRQQMSWQARGLDLRIGVNLSAKTANDPGFAAQVAQSCETWGLSPDSLLFELTEDSIVRNEHATIECMRALRNIGCELSIDDFGTGYSSFAYLRQFPVHELKIDRLFIQNLARDRGDQQIVKALIDLAHAFNLRALAEGVDDPAAVHMLRDFGCDRVQGFLYARAMPAEQFVDWVQRFNQGEAMESMVRDGVTRNDSGASIALGTN
jgi:EAL domain-containing protein (putative c-di-GMP-specific phosphodiesterase class I)/GGDEF domain-containing protein